MWLLILQHGCCTQCVALITIRQAMAQGGVNFSSATHHAVTLPTALVALTTQSTPLFITININATHDITNSTVTPQYMTNTGNCLHHLHLALVQHAALPIGSSPALQYDYNQGVARTSLVLSIAFRIATFSFSKADRTFRYSPRCWEK